MSYCSEVIIREIQWRICELIQNLSLVKRNEVAVGLLGAALLELELRRHNIDDEFWQATLRNEDVTISDLAPLKDGPRYEEILRELEMEFSSCLRS